MTLITRLGRRLRRRRALLWRISLRVSVQQFRAVLPSSSGAAPRAEHMARCSDHRGQGPRPGPVPRAPRGLLHPRAVVEGEEAENDSGGASIAPRARARMRVAARGPLAHAPVAPSTCTRCRRPSAAAAQPSDSRALPSLASQARGCSPCACSHRRARLAAGRHTRAESGLGVGSCPRLARCELRGHGCLRAECVRLPDGVCVWS